MDRIVVEGIEVWARHGVLPHEGELGQRFVIDLAIEVDLATAGRTDDLADTVDYGTLAARVHDTVAGERYRLIEAVAARVAELCLDDARVAAAEVRVRKPSAPLTVPAGEVRVELRRERTAQ